MCRPPSPARQRVLFLLVMECCLLPVAFCMAELMSAWGARNLVWRGCVEIQLFDFVASVSAHAWALRNFFQAFLLPHGLVYASMHQSRIWRKD